MFKKYDPRRVRSYRSYRLSDICRLFSDKKLHVQTIRGWINDGELKAFSDGKNHLVCGAVLKAFLHNRNDQHKRTLTFEQFRCGKCKTIAIPLDNTITTLTIGRSNCILAYGICSACGHRIHRLYKRDLEQKIIQSFRVQHNELERLCNHSNSTGNAHHLIGAKIAQDESCQNVPGPADNATPTTPSTTHHAAENNASTTTNTHHDPRQLTLL